MWKRVMFFVLAIAMAMAMLGGAGLVRSQEAKINPDLYKQMRYRISKMPSRREKPQLK
jgi:Na+(H+)/acetate symporter ActP